MHDVAISLGDASARRPRVRPHRPAIARTPECPHPQPASPTSHSSHSSHPAPTTEPSNIREIHAALAQLCAAMNGWLTEIERILHPNPFQRILSVVARSWNVTELSIMGRSRTPRIAFARQFAMYLNVQLLGNTSQVGRDFGRDHGTVIHSVRAVRDRIETEPSTALLCRQVAQSLGIPID